MARRGSSGWRGARAGSRGSRRSTFSCRWRRCRSSCAGSGSRASRVYAVLMACAAVFVIFADFSFNVTGPLRVAGRGGGGAARGAPCRLAGAEGRADRCRRRRSSWRWWRAAGPEAALALAYALALTLTPRWLVYSLGRLRGVRAALGGEPAGVARGGGLAGARPGDLLWLLAVSVAAQAVTTGGGVRPRLAGGAGRGQPAAAGADLRARTSGSSGRSWRRRAGGS